MDGPIPLTSKPEGDVTTKGSECGTRICIGGDKGAEFFIIPVGGRLELTRCLTGGTRLVLQTESEVHKDEWVDRGAWLLNQGREQARA